MCMLCVVPPNVIPDKDMLENSCLNNPHGFGYAIAIPKEERIQVFTSMNADECISRFLFDRALYPEAHAIFHARYATHGASNLANCHPFKVVDDKTYLAHNGILPILESNKEDRSDTRIFAEDLMPAIGGVVALDNSQVWNMLEDFTTGSKVAFLTVDPKAEHELYLLHEEKGHYDKSGVWWSNDTCYLDYGYPYAYNKYMSHYLHDTKDMEKGTPSDDPDTYFLECHTCDSVQEYWESLKKGNDSFCGTCGTCYDCNTHKNNCLCYRGRQVYENRTAKSALIKNPETEIPAWGWY